MKNSSVVAAVASTAAATYFLDPVLGRRRRAIARDKIVSGLRQAEHAGLVTAIDLVNRTRGVTAELRSKLASEPAGVQVLDDQLEEHAGNVPELQEWSPATRALLGGSGVALIGCALVRRSPLAMLLGLAGGVLLMCASTDVERPAEQREAGL